MTYNVFGGTLSLTQSVWRRSSTTTSSDVKVRRPVLTLLKAENRALESVGFMTQCTPRHPLPTGHHTSDLVPLPAGTLPDDDALLRNVARPPPPDMPGNYCRGCC